MLRNCLHSVLRVQNLCLQWLHVPDELLQQKEEEMDDYCSEEWVTDSPFIISPRITFEVSVRLLGVLMALGYTIATILKRNSHVFSDDKVCVKSDWLEQINRRKTASTTCLTILCIKFLCYVYGRQWTKL